MKRRAYLMRLKPGCAAEYRRRHEELWPEMAETLKAAGLATRKDPVKILARGEITKSLTVKAHGFSAAAKEKIEAAGGSCELID